MKNVFRSLSLLLLLTLMLFSCGEETPKKPGGTPDNVTSTSTPATAGLIFGQVRRMSDKTPIAGVGIQGAAGPAFLSDAEGKFQLPIFTGMPITAEYTMAGYELLKHEYAQIDFIDSIIVYLEDATTPIANSKTTNGLTKKYNEKNILTAIDSIRVIDTVSKDTVFTNNGGDYKLSFDKGMTVYKYDFKIGQAITIHSMIVKNLSGIKDSTRLDVVFTGTATGIDIEIGDQ